MRRLGTTFALAALAILGLPHQGQAQGCTNNGEGRLVRLGTRQGVELAACFPTRGSMGSWDFFMGARNRTSHRLRITFSYDVTLANGEVDRGNPVRLTLDPSEMEGGANLLGTIGLDRHYFQREQRPIRVRVTAFEVEDLTRAEDDATADAQAQEEEEARERMAAVERERRAEDARRRQREVERRREEEERERRAQLARGQERLDREEEARIAEQERQRAEQERVEQWRREQDESHRELAEERQASGQAWTNDATSAFASALLIGSTGSVYRGLSWRARVTVSVGWYSRPVLENSRREVDGRIVSESSGIGTGFGLGVGLRGELWPVHSGRVGLAGFVESVGGGASAGSGVTSTSGYYAHVGGGARIRVGDPWIALVGEFGYLGRTSGSSSNTFISGVRNAGGGSGDEGVVRLGFGAELCFAVEADFCTAPLELSALLDLTDSPLGEQEWGWTFRLRQQFPDFGLSAWGLLAEVGIQQPAVGEALRPVDQPARDFSVIGALQVSWDWFGEPYLGGAGTTESEGLDADE